MADWLADSLQIAWFLPDVSKMQASRIFHAIWESEPDQIQERKFPTPQHPYLSQAVSAVDGVTRIAQVNFGRADVIVRAQASNEDAFANHFPLEEAATNLIEQISRSHPIEIEAFRVAIVANLLKRSIDYRDAATEFFRTLGTNYGRPDAQDLSATINIRTILSDREVNRIFAASVAISTTFNLQLHPQMAQEQPPGETEYAARRTFDFNTVPVEGHLLAPDQQVTILKSLAREMFDIAKDGRFAALSA